MCCRQLVLWAAVWLSATALSAQAPETQKVRINTPYVPTPPEVATAMLKAADVKPGDLVYDLGCGDGRIVIAAAREFGARGVGVDLYREHIAEAQRKAREAGVAERVEFRQQDLFDTDIRPATVVALYLLPEVNLELRPKLLRELKPGARVVSHTFDFGDWKPDRQFEVNGEKVFLWVIPGRRL
jgi:2-polyprenyl-3-methyl-5-hydroxy-6-metoxy-1,4-benzoquinol methylase